MSADEDAFWFENKKEESPVENIPASVRTEIDNMYEFLPELKKHFQVMKKIGEGTFSSVFQAKLRNHPKVDQLFALKHIIPTSHPSRIETELKCLQQLGGKNNVMGVELCLRSKDHIVIVMPYFPHDRFQDCLLSLTPDEIKNYMKNLLIALKHIHEYDVIHRDVKPSNFLFNRKTQQFSLVDFGLAHKAPVALKKNDARTQFELPIYHQSPKKKNIKTTSKFEASSHGPLRSLNASKGPSLALDKRGHKSHKNTTSVTTGSTSRSVRSPRQLLLMKQAMSKARPSLPPSSQKSSSRLITCSCFGKAMVCRICTERVNQIAPRAGTPGFRSPEVLMKYPHQTTSVDIWSAGVIFLSLLSGRYPFFKANDDLTALAQIITLMGSEPVKNAAKIIGKDLICLPQTKSMNLQNLCFNLRNVETNEKCKPGTQPENKTASQFIEAVTHSAFDLLVKMLNLNPNTRITAEDALEHEYFK